ncbi:MAG: hypothetical protein ABW321_04010 [Polyangiales bacterium]
MARWLCLCAGLFAIAALGYRETTRAADARTLGAACESTHECQVGTRCVDLEGVMPGQCTAACNADSTCTQAFGAEAQCLGADMCARTCREASDCPDGTACNAYGWCERPDPS